MGEAMDGAGGASGDSAGLGQDELFAMDESFLLELMDLEAFSSLYDSPSLLSGGSGSSDLGCVRVPTNHFPPNGDLHPPVELLLTTTTERIWQALKLYVRIAKGEVLAQVWMPMRQGGRFVLATDAQPFMATEMDRLLHFRRHSATFRFSTEDGGDGDGSCLGLPGRVFRTRKPEWTPNVQLYRAHEYLRRNLAIDCNVRGTICLPVFDNHLANSCIAVIELAMLSERISYTDDINSICQALQAVNLCSSETHCQLPMQVKSDMRQAVLMELTEVLKIVSKTHKLPLVQTWLPYHIKEWQKEKGAKAGEVCLCTKGMPFYMGDMSVEGFRQACTEHYLGKGQGVAGKAYTCNEPVFSSDVKSYGKLEYPLCHYAEMFRLTAAVAIRLRSVLTGNDDYILEFFLPRACIGFPSQQCLLNALSASMQHVCVSLRTVTNKELEEEEERQGSCPPEKMAVVRPEVCDFPLSGAHHLVQESKRLRHERGRGGTVEKTIGLSILQQYFAGSLKDAAKSIGVCPTTLKRICRQHGIPRWPSRKIKKVSRTLKKLQVVIDSVQGASEGAVRINALASDLASMGATAPLSSQEGLTKSWGGGIPQKLANGNNEEGSDTSKKVDMRKLSNGDRKVEEEEVSLEELIHPTSLENESEGSPSTSSERSSRQSEQESSWTMVEAMCGNSTARFKLHLKAGYRELMEEVGKIFKLHVDSFDLKYFDDDEEWVMLTCESDLSECIDVLKSSAQNHIKLSVRQCLTKSNHIG